VCLLGVYRDACLPCMHVFELEGLSRIPIEPSTRTIEPRYTMYRPPATRPLERWETRRGRGASPRRAGWGPLGIEGRWPPPPDSRVHDDL